MSLDRRIPHPLISRFLQPQTETPVNVREPFHILAQGIRDRAILPGNRIGKISTGFAALQKDYPMQTLLNGEERIGDYISSGEGERVLVVLPGIIESPYGHIHNFAIPGYKVVIPDYTTFNYPQNVSYEEMITAFNRSLDVFLSTIAGGRPITLAGVSLGGLLVQRYLASNHTANVERRVLIQTAALGADVFSKGFLNRAATIGDLLNGGQMRAAFTIRRGGGDREISNDVSTEADENVVRAVISYAMHHYRRRISHEQLEIIRKLAMYFGKLPKDQAQKLRERTPSIDTLLIDNRLDNIFPPERSGLRGAYPNAQLVDLDSQRKHRSSWFDVRKIATSISLFVA
ncbi:MAG TPA: alpha/beta hydrolase [Patescibacteria group bacterium]